MLQKLTSFVTNFRKNNPSGWSKLLYGFVALISAAVLITVYVIRSNLRSKELAALKHDLDVAKEHLIQAGVAATLAKHEDTKQAALTRAQVLLEEVKELEQAVAQVEETYANDRALIASLRTWEDIDAKVR